MAFVFTPPATVGLPVSGSDELFPVRRVYCVGRNYAAHAREMGKDPTREKPFFFMKPADCVADSGGTLPYPPLTANLHHEIELVVAIATGGSDIAVADALAHAWGYGVGVDLTRRDLQEEAKAAGRPWDWGKGFDKSAPCGPLSPAACTGHPVAGRIWLSVNGDTRQQGDLAELIWSVPEIIAACSASVRLEPGDLIFTGTPAGVGPLLPGDHVIGGVDGIGTIEFTIGVAAGVVAATLR